VLLLLATPFIYQGSTNYVANELVRDKETKMKETLKIMGLKPWIYSLSFMV
jgi:lysozyme family protein